MHKNEMKPKIARITMTAIMPAIIPKTEHKSKKIFPTSSRINLTAFSIGTELSEAVRVVAVSLTIELIAIERPAENCLRAATIQVAVDFGVFSLEKSLQFAAVVNA